MILSSCGRLRPREARLERSHEDEIPFSLEYRTQFIDTTCGKLNFGYAFLLERVQNQALHTECEKILFVTQARRRFKPFGKHLHEDKITFTH